MGHIYQSHSDIRKLGCCYTWVCYLIKKIIMIHPLAAFCTWVNAEQFGGATLSQGFAHKDPLWVWQIIWVIDHSRGWGVCVTTSMHVRVWQVVHSAGSSYWCATWPLTCRASVLWASLISNRGLLTVGWVTEGLVQKGPCEVSLAASTTASLVNGNYVTQELYGSQQPASKDIPRVTSI